MDIHELIEKVSDGSSIKKDFVRVLIGRIVSEIKKTVVKGEHVHIRGFGYFGARKMAARRRRNPKTGQVATFPATTTVKFRPSTAFRDEVSGKRTPGGG